MDKDKSITCPLSDQRGGDNRLAESRHRRQDAVFVQLQRFECLDLWTVQSSQEPRLRRQQKSELGDAVQILRNSLLAGI